MKKLVLILAAIIVLAVIGGCGSGSQSSGEESKEEANTNESSSTEVEEDENKQEDQSKEKDSSSESEGTSDKKEQVYDEDNHVINVSAFEMGYDPEDITLKKGVEYELVMTNDGESFHDLTSTELKADITFKGEMADHPESTSMIDQIFGVQKVHADGGSHDKKSFHMNTKPGQTVRLKFIPTETGEYAFACSIPGHKEAGMSGTFTVIE